MIDVAGPVPTDSYQPFCPTVYHLDRLVPRFVRKVEDGYRLTHAGRRVVGAAVSGVYTDGDTAVGPRPVGDCPACGGTVETGYGEGRMRIECADCEVVVTDADAPPILAASHDTEDLPLVYSRYLLTEIERMNRGFCPNCSGPVEASVDRTTGREGDEAFSDHVTVVHACRECGLELSSVVAVAVLDHPAVVSVLFEAGIDVRETPVWEPTPLFEAPGNVVSEDPLRVEVTVETGGQTLTLTLDGSGDVVDYGSEGSG